MITEFTTLLPSSEPILIKEKGSKFIAFAYQIHDEDTAKKHIAELWKLHPQATHICYAYQIGIENPIVRINDDGEPNYSAGQPIHHQIISHHLTNVLIAVIRYYGGTKLGVSGLISAYKQAAKEAIEASEIRVEELQKEVKLECEYHQLSLINKLLHQFPHKIIQIQQEEKCYYTISFALKRYDSIYEFAVLHNLIAQKNE